MKILLDALIIISLFVIPALIWYSIRTSKVKKYYERQADNHAKAADDERFVDAIVADKMDVRRLVDRCSGYHPKSEIDAIYDELKDDLIAVFGDDYRSKFVLPGRFKVGEFYVPSNTSMWAVQLLLARQGKIDSRFDSFYLGYPIGGSADKDWNIGICKRIEKHLIEHHPEYTEDLKLYKVAQATPVYNSVQRRVQYVNSTYGECAGELSFGRWHKETGRRLW